MATSNTNAADKKAPAIAVTISRDQPTGGYTTNDVLQLRFADGRIVSLQVGDLQPHIIADALMHGLKQKLVDAAAIPRNLETGHSATLSDKYNAVKEVADRLVAGSWNKAAGDGSTGSGGLLLRALFRHYKEEKPMPVLIAYLEKKTDKEKAAMRKIPAIAAIIEQIKAESTDTKGVDAENLLEELDGLGDAGEGESDESSEG